MKITPQEKAKELVEKFDNVDFIISYVRDSTAKQCALIAINEILHTLSLANGGGFQSEYYQQVKEEIAKIK